MTKTERNENRDKRSGQYNHSLDRVCVCGHTKGEHDAEPPYPRDEFNCPKFRPAR